MSTKSVTSKSGATKESTITDLRSCLKLLEGIPGQLLRTEHPVDPMAELAGVYRYVGAGCPVEPPTKLGPAMMFENIKGFPGMRIVTGIMSSRERVAHMFQYPKERLGFLLLEALENAIPPVVTKDPTPPCQEVVHKGNIDLTKLLPAPTQTVYDAGPYFSMGLLRATDPETGKSDVTIHRLCVQSKDEISIWFTPGRHIEAMREKAEKAGKALPLSISIGVDPAVYIAAGFEPPTTPLGMDELAVAGGMRGVPVELCKCITNDEYAIANAEIVIEGEILPNVRVREDQHSNTGFSMPEFPGYNGPAKPALPLMKVTCVTHRKNPILQTTVGPAEEHTSLAGIPTEASILKMCEDSMPGKLLNVYSHSSGGGKFLAIMQFKKTKPTDEGRHRQAALTAFAAYSELKHVILVDEDVDIFDTNDVLWAMTTRFQGDIDTIFIPNCMHHPLDPSDNPEYSYSIRQQSAACKTIFDATVPFAMKDKFKRAQFKEITPEELAKFTTPSKKPLVL
jgi:4-hydroxy-3-polyprenylbenzoate decarboxylase